MGAAGSEPRIEPVGDRAVLVRFGDGIDDTTITRVRALDAALVADPPVGTTEVVPATTSLLVVFDPLVTDHAAVGQAVGARLARRSPPEATDHHVVDVCYDDEFAPDLGTVAGMTGLDPAEVVAGHLSARYTVAMYGFAPGYAYLVGVPEPIRLPRRPTPGPPVPAGSVLVTGQQCLIVPTALSTGWFAIGRSPFRVFDPDDEQPFRFGVGDTIGFRRIDADTMRRCLATSEESVR